MPNSGISKHAARHSTQEVPYQTIDDTNRAAVVALGVFDQQKQFIAPNKLSLETAGKEEYRELARPFAIYADGTLVGFTMFAFELTSSDPEDRYWLWRFMIDKHAQGKGYGSAALKTIIDYFKSHGATHILLSTMEANTQALSLYHKHQFVETGTCVEEEIVLRLTL